MAYRDLSLQERHAIIRESVANGIRRLSDIEAAYNAAQQPANEFAEGGSIHIAPSKRGTFTAAATKHGKSVQAFASQVLAHKENYSPAMVKKANFARNAAHWHDNGGQEYTVQRGDTLSNIAQRFTGKASNYMQLAGANGIENPNLIKVGQKIVIPTKFDTPLKLDEIPTNNRVHVIDNYSPNFNYVVEGDKVYYARKGNDSWVDISDNGKARQNLLNFLQSKYDLKGYEDDERDIMHMVNMGMFNYDSYHNQENQPSIPPQYAFKDYSEQISSLPSYLGVESILAATPKLPASNMQEDIQKVAPVLEPKPEEERMGLSDYFDLGKNWISRQAAKYGLFGNEEEESALAAPVENPGQYGIIPGSFVGDTIPVGNANNDVYITPESLNLSEHSFGYRNRGQNTPIESEGAPITTFHPFVEYNSSNPYTGKYKTFIGIDKKGNLKVGGIENFNEGDMITPSFSNEFTEFIHEDNGDYKKERDSKHGNRSRYVPKLLTTDGKEGSLNILSTTSGDFGTYGTISGGRVIVKVGDEIRLLSGSIENIEQEFENMKKRNKASYGTFYTLDNGSFNRGLRTKSGRFSEEQLKDYDTQNSGDSGNFLYLQPKALTFESDTVLTPNIRTEQSESYISGGHPLVNTNEGIVLHYTAFDNDDDLTEVTKHLTSPNTEASAHVIIGADGKRRVLATPDKVTFHAGYSSFNGRENVNDFMHGIEFQNNGKTPLTQEQIDSFIEYALPIIRKYNIPLENIVTHSTVRKNYNKGKSIFEKKPDKQDLTDEQYQQLVEALKEKVYYKKAFGGSLQIAKKNSAQDTQRLKDWVSKLLQINDRTLDAKRFGYNDENNAHRYDGGGDSSNGMMLQKTFTRGPQIPSLIDNVWKSKNEVEDAILESPITKIMDDIYEQEAEKARIDAIWGGAPYALNVTGDYPNMMNLVAKHNRFIEDRRQQDEQLAIPYLADKEVRSRRAWDRSTGGPLYPFSFTKPIPPVRY